MGSTHEEIDDFNVDNLEKRVVEIVEEATDLTISKIELFEWMSFSFRSVSMPISMENIEPNVRLMYGDNPTCTYPILMKDGKNYFAGPIERQSELDSPMDLLVEADEGELQLQLNLKWSYFTEEGEEGYIRIQKYLEILRQRGWEQQHYER